MSPLGIHPGSVDRLLCSSTRPARTPIQKAPMDGSHGESQKHRAARSLAASSSFSGTFLCHQLDLNFYRKTCTFRIMTIGD